MKDKIKKVSKNSKQIKVILIASLGVNLAMTGVIAYKCLESNGLTTNNESTSYQEVLNAWKPFADTEPLQESMEESSEELLPSEDNAVLNPESIEVEISTENNESNLEEQSSISEDSQILEEEEQTLDLPSAEDVLEEEEPVSSEEVNGFSVHTISESLQASLNDLVIPDPSVITYDDLRLVKVLYWGFDNQTHMGELIVNKAVAEEMMEIFEEVYAVRYPIEKIRLVSEYKNSDEASMEDNNTSSFNYREVTNASGFSLHAYGLAIDINPKMNPYVTDDYVLPSNGMAYVDREQNIPGMIQEGDALHKAFTSRGWSWGGDWDGLKDYQHFSKSLN